MRYITNALILAFIPLSAWADTYKGIQILPEVNDPPVIGTYTGYWIDADGDHEDTRQEVLIEESLVPATVRTKPNDWRKDHRDETYFII